jgi:hypothetical protein
VAKQLAFRAPDSATSRVVSKVGVELELWSDRPRTDRSRQSRSGGTVELVELQFELELELECERDAKEGEDEGPRTES